MDTNPHNAVSLREFIERVINEHEKQSIVHWLTHEEAHRIADRLREARDEGQNEWRDTLNDALNRFATRDTVEGYRHEREIQLSQLHQDMGQIRNDFSNLQGRLYGIAGALTFLILVVAAIERFIPK